jgi:hypothetical protein
MIKASELRIQLDETRKKLESGEITTKEAGEFANIAGKMISSAKVQIEYYALIEKAPVIDFLKDDSA